MAQTAKADVPADIFAVRDISKHLNADRVLTATPAPYWVWPFKKWITAYQVHKGRSYQQEGNSVLKRAEANSDAFREGPAEALREEHSYVVQDLQDMYQNPDRISKTASRRYKRRARNNRNHIVISTEAFEARGTYCIAVGAKDDTGMPSSITSLTTTSTSLQPPPRHDSVEPRVLSQQEHLFLGPDLQVTEPSAALKNTLEWAVAQLNIVKEVPEESAASLPEGPDDELLGPGPSGAIPVAA
ncbi:hypothetical protein C8T65DRAFT_739954 [Cerioporus squamosus]|nr:hypothetical protein C8T65DRAFT_739954 [Cerioporus squamosus]